MLRRFFAAAIIACAPGLAWGQATPTGTFTPGHAIMTLTPSGSPYGDVAGAGGSTHAPGTLGGNLTSLGITGTGTPFCINDALTNAPGGSHALCFGANSLGGGLISYNAYGTARPLSFYINLNGVTYPFPGNSNGNVMGAATTVVNDIPYWGNTAGTLLADSGLSFAKIAPYFVKMSLYGVSTGATAAANTTNAQSAIDTAHSNGGGVICDVVGQIPFTSLVTYNGDSYDAVPGCVWQMSADGAGWHTVNAPGDTYAKLQVANDKMRNLHVNMNGHNGMGIMMEATRGDSELYLPVVTGTPAAGSWSYVAQVGTDTLPNAAIGLKAGYAVDNVQETMVYKPIVNGPTWVPASNTCSGALGPVGIWLGTDPDPPAVSIHNYATHNHIIEPVGFCNTIGLEIADGNDNVIEQPEFTASATAIVLGQSTGGTVVRNHITKVYAENVTTAVITTYPTADASNTVSLASTAGSTTIENGTGNVTYDNVGSSGWRVPIVGAGYGGLGISWQNPPGTVAGNSAPFCPTSSMNCKPEDGAEGADIAHQVIAWGTKIAHFTGDNIAGTHASPTPAASGQVLASHDGGGGGNTSGTLSYITGGMQITASELFTSAHQGSHLDFFTTPIGTKASSVWMSLSDAGNLIVSQNAQAPINAPAGVHGTVTAIGVDGSPANLSSASAASPSYTTLQRGDGTMAVPTALQTGEVIGQFGFGGYGTSWTGVTPHKAFLRGTATGIWSGSSTPTSESIYTTPAASTTPLIAMLWDSSQNTTAQGSFTNSGIASGAQADVVCTTSAGLFSYQVSGTGCAASAKALKNQIGSVNPFVALYRVMRYLPFGAPIWAYKTSPDTVQVGLYADDVCAMDERLCARDANGAVFNYDKNGVLAYLAAAFQAIIYLFLALILGLIVAMADLYRRVRRGETR